MPRHGRYPAELRERAVRMVREHRGEYGSEWELITSIANKLGPTPETVRLWVRQDQINHGGRHPDAIGSVAGLTDAAGDPISRTSYEPFGEVRSVDSLTSEGTSPFAPSHPELDENPTEGAALTAGRGPGRGGFVATDAATWTRTSPVVSSHECSEEIGSFHEDEK